MGIVHRRGPNVFVIIAIALFLTSTFVVSVFLTRGSLDFRSRASFSGNDADVVVVGAGTGGTAAAIQAARSGATVILLEETDWIGGQMTAAGVSSMDGGDPAWTGGIYKEFIDRVKIYYQAKGKSLGTCYFNPASTCFEPKAGKTILEDMVYREPLISLRYRSTVLSVQKSGNRINSLTVRENGSTKTITGKMVIDATEYGDLLPLAGVPYRVGNSTSAAPNPDACIQDITYTAIIKKYPQGVPANLKITSPPPGYSESVQNTFAGVVAKDGHAAWSGAYPVTWPLHNVYRGVPDSSAQGSYDAANPPAISKTGVNWANDFPASVRYIEDKAYRKDINCQAKLRTIQFLYYAQTVLNEPLWSIANDEGYDTPYNREENSCANIPDSLKAIERNMPVIPYVRESRRALGSFTLTGKDLKRTGTPLKAVRTFSSSVAVGDYPVDLHRCGNPENLEASLETKADWPEGFVGGPFQVPYESLVPGTLDNVIVAEKNLSQSRLANGATRLQPITMLTGQAAGIIAALSVQKNIAPASLNVRFVQKALTESGAHIVAFTDVPKESQEFAAIQQAAARTIMIGGGNLQFHPEGSLTRGQAASVLSSAFSIPNHTPPTPTFGDVPVSDSLFPSIEGIFKAGITAGCATNPLRFCPNDPVTNAQFSVMALRGSVSLGMPIPTKSPAAPTYSDVPTNHWAYPFVEGLSGIGIRSYCDSAAKKFCPDAPMTRKRAAVTISGILTQRDANVSPTVPTTQPTQIPTTPLTPTVSPEAHNPSDVDNNNAVNIIDYTLFMSGWYLNNLEIVDLNDDGEKSAIDYTMFMNGWDEYQKTH